MSTKGIVRYDDYLTNLALAYPTGNMIGEIVAPKVKAEFFSDNVYVDGQDAMDQVSDEAEGTPANEVNFDIGTPYSYRTKRRALSTVITQKELQNASKKGVVRLEQRSTNKLTHRLKLKHETRVTAIMTSTSKITQYADISDSNHTQLDETSPTLENDIEVAINTIYDSTGAKANTIIIPFKAGVFMSSIPFIKDTLKYQYGMEYVTGIFQKQVMDLIGLPPYIKGLKVIISDGRKNTAEKGQTRSFSATWGTNILIGYIPPSPTVDSMFGILTMEYESMKIQKENLTNPRGKNIINEWDYDILEAELKCWYLMTNVI